MDDDSRPQRLPLAEAVLTWSPARLVDAVRDAEVAVPAEELVRWERDPIALMTSRRARPQRGRKLSISGLPASIVALDRAWDAVFDDVRTKVETGEIMLRARMVRPDTWQNAQPIPGVWGRVLDFDLRAGAIFMQDQIFVAVEASVSLTEIARRLGSESADAGAPVGAGADEQVQHLTLLEALVQWCDPRLVNRVREEERKLIAYELHQYPMPKLSHESEWCRPTNTSWMAPTDFVFLRAAWNDLTTDFRARIAQGALYLEGVLSGDDPNAQPETIPNMWAAELLFDLRGNVVERAKRRYLAVTVSRQPSPWAALDRTRSAEPAARDPLTKEAIAALTDEEILNLLEEHAKRVVESDADMIMPGKISLMPIIRRKMEHRAAQGQLAGSLSAECQVLEAWIYGKVPSHQTPTAGSIENSLRKDYAALKARSNGMIP